MHVAVAGVAPGQPYLLDDPGGVGDRIGVGHGVNRCVAAEGSRQRAGLDRFGVLATRLAQVGMQIDEAGERHQSISLKDARAAVRQAGFDCRDHAVVEQHVHRLGALGNAVALEQPATHAAPPSVSVSSSGNGSKPIADSLPPRRRYRTAIRTLTPFVTCSTITERAESATSAAISMPRFIGPGCMTIAWSGSTAMRAASRP